MLDDPPEEPACEYRKRLFVAAIAIYEKTKL